MSLVNKHLVPEIFRFSAKVQLAETISYISPVPIESVDILIQSCLSLLPNQQYKDVQPNDPSIKKIFDLNPTILSTMISIRAQESVIALAHFFKCSNGVADKRVIPILKSFLMYLTYFGGANNSNINTSNTSNTSSSNSGSNPIFSQSNGLSPISGLHQNDLQNSQSFTYYLLNQLSILSNISNELRDDIVPTFLHFFDQIIKNEQNPIILGTLQALSDKNNSFDFSQEQLLKVIENIENIIEAATQKKTLLLVCQALEQITYLPAVDQDIYKRIYRDIFPYTSTLPTDNEAFISIINVIVRCGKLNSNIGKEVLDFLIRFMSEIKNLTDNETSASLNKAFSEQLYQTVLLSFVEIADIYSDKTLKVVDVLKEFLVSSNIIKNNEETRNNLFSCICTILKNEYKKERGVEVCKTIITSLLNSLHTQYTNYKNSSISEPFNTPTSSSSTLSNSSSKSPPLYSNPTLFSLSNIIIVLGKITCTLNDPMIIEIILQNFMSRVSSFYPPSQIENLIIFQLTDIALLEHQNVTKDIVVLITNLFKKICKDPNQGLISNITDKALEKLAKHLTNEELRLDLCRRVLKLFQQLGKSFRRPDGREGKDNSSDPNNYYITSPILKGMGFLLPTIAELIKVIPIKFNTNDIPPAEPANPSLPTSPTNTNSNTASEIENISSIKLYRSVWFYCVFFKFSIQGVWRSDWWNSVQIIAAHLSPLISTKPHIYLEMEVELDSIIKQGLEKDYFYNVKTSLIEALPNHSAYIKNLSLPQLAFIHSVYILETMRFAVSGSFEPAFSYLEDQGIENINVTSSIRGIVDKVFADFLTGYGSISNFITIEQELSAHASFLLIKFCYPYEPVRKAADDYISTLVTKFPQVLWSKQCLSTLLDLIEAIGKGAKAKPMDMISVQMSHSQITIELPDETPVRQRLLSDIIALGNIWLKSGANAAPSEIQELLQEYMQKFNQLKREHIGLSLAVEIGANADINSDKLVSGNHDNIQVAAASNQNGSAFPTCFNSNAANFVNSLQLKALYSGEIKGMINMMAMSMGVNTCNNNGDIEDEELSEEIENRAYDSLVKEFESLIQLAHKNSLPVNNMAFISIMYRSCAFLINHYFGSSIRLIHMVCYAPAYFFTAESMEIGIGCWKWLLTERPDLTKFIMTSISDIWAWTVNQRIGLFANNEREPSPLAISGQQQSMDQQQVTEILSDKHDINIEEQQHFENDKNKYIRQFKPPQSIDKTSDIPHKIWLDFLEERYSVAKYGSQDQMDIIIGILQKSIMDPDGLSVSPKSLGSRFKLLLLCTKLLQGDHIHDPFSARLMRERVYLASLTWFYLPPAWYGPAEAGSQSQLEIDTKTLIEFCKALQSEPIYQFMEKRFTFSSKNSNSSGNNISLQNAINAAGNGSDRSNSVSAPMYASIRGNKTNSITMSNSNSFHGIDQSNGSITSASGINQLNSSNIGNTASGYSTANSTPNNPLIYGSGGFSMHNYGSGIGVGISSSMINGSTGYQPSSNRSSGLKQINETGSATSSSFDINGDMEYISSGSTRMIDVAGSGVGTMTSLVGQQISQTLLLDSMKPLENNKPAMTEAHLIELKKRRNLILLLVGNELERMSAWNSPVSRISTQIPEQTKFVYENLPKSMKSKWKDYLISAWKINPKLAIHFSSRFPLSKIRNLISEMVVKNTKAVLDIPEALPFLVTEENVKANIPELKYLLYWETVTPPMAISLLGKSYHSHPLVSQYACRVLRSFPPETIMFYIPQLVQALRYDRSGQVENYLVSASKTSELLAHQIIWNIQTYTEPDPNGRIILDDPLIQSVSKRLKDRVIDEMQDSEKIYNNYKEEFAFFESFTAISGRLLQLKDPSKRKGQLKDELRMLTVNNNGSPLYMPTNPKSLVVGLEVDSAMTLQSAAKVPILVNFKVVERALPTPTSNLSHVRSPPPSGSPPIENTSHVDPIGGSATSSIGSNQLTIPNNKNHKNHLANSSSILRESSRALRKNISKKVTQDQPSQSNIVHIQGCIFKSGDDIRQDMLALQIIDIFKRIFKSVGLDLYLFPYKAIATKPGCGMIELVPNTMSRDQIGKKVNGNLYNYFISKYGNKNSIGFQNARRNFIKSMAAYSVVSYILQIKDRHNANILVDEEGHIVHIDFGFIFDISPGGDMITFEASPFKMNQEMIDIMGGKPNAEQFVWFMEQSVRAFLAARQHMDSIITLVELMLDTKLPCFKDQTIHNLRQRFCPNKSETYAAKFMSKIVLDSFSTISTFSTYFYDVFQYYDNGIEM
ncbi:hypothetical protein DICPUDRAFT_158137 [Dictyostelium purpureum]|uniref:1-phosphatidylinositol 4-kinase n=1 Tax=Dictyostelium purpureum TaxID=5786 RepID=F1A0X4_DICPU|nr:uncharacterized protein DICPUDRAFT_158137 [Dictyostelium purpureum]EGC30157.1 hypothetical protein DICPUDRAFT_158137 [Dictyostelium purpureum]|eukprot:XP_003293319.1 hypothetical protein DICPUDRAFT_158137 [Dictyostelium purpureum]